MIKEEGLRVDDDRPRVLHPHGGDPAVAAVQARRVHVEERVVGRRVDVFDEGLEVGIVEGVKMLF